MFRMTRILAVISALTLCFSLSVRAADTAKSAPKTILAGGFSTSDWRYSLIFNKINGTELVSTLIITRKGFGSVNAHVASADFSNDPSGKRIASIEFDGYLDSTDNLPTAQQRPAHILTQILETDSVKHVGSVRWLITEKKTGKVNDSAEVRNADKTTGFLAGPLMANFE